MGLTCADGSLTTPLRRLANFSLAPSFGIAPDAPVVPIARLAATVYLLPELTAVAAGGVDVGDATSVDLTLTVPLASPDDRFRVVLVGLGAAGDTVYRAVADDVSPDVPGTPPAPVPVTLTYAGADTLIKSVQIAPRDTTLLVGDGMRLRATAFRADGQPKPDAALNFVSRDPANVAVQPDGQLTALGPVSGAWVVVATANGKYDSTQVTTRPRRALARIEAGPDRAVSAIGDTVQLSPTGFDQEGVAMEGAAFSFEALEPAVATVDAAGVVTTHAVGSGRIVVRPAPATGAAGATALAGEIADTVMVTVGQTPASVAATPAITGLTAIGEEVTLTAEVRDRNGNVIPGSALVWTSLTPGVASVRSSGTSTAIVSAVGAGAGLVAVAAGAVADTVSVSVTQTPASLAASPDTVTLIAVGDATTLAAEVRDRNGVAIAGSTIGWSSTATAVATVNAAGVVTATGPGTARVIAVSGALRDTTIVIVRQDAATLVIAPSADTLNALGEQHQLTVRVADANGNVIPNVAPTWRSTAASVASVTATGVVRALAVGTTQVIATAGGIADTIPVLVRQLPASVLVPQVDTTLTALGDTRQLSATLRDRNLNAIPGATFAWSSTVPSVATVSTSGLVTAAANGVTRVIAASGGFADTVVITVAQSAASLVVSPDGGALSAIGAALQLGATVRDRRGAAMSGAAVTWTSRAPSVASVSASGLVTAAANGSAQIVATSGAAADTVVVTVSQAAARVIISPDSVPLTAIGDTRTLGVTVQDARGIAIAGAAVTWSSTAPAVASIDGATRVVTARAVGTARVIAQSGTVADTIPVVVTQTPAGLVVEPATLAFSAVGDAQPLTASLRDRNGNVIPGATFAWTSTATSVATVSGAGSVTSVANGTARVIAAASGFADTTVVTVSQVPATLAVAPTSATLTALAETRALAATVRDRNNVVIPGAPVSWASRQAGVATVNATSGVVTAAGNGVATIDATAGSATGTTSITVEQAVDTIVLSRDTLRLANRGDQGSIVATVLDRNRFAATNHPPVYSSSEANVATVDQSGLVTLTGSGVATIAATAGGKRATAVVIKTPADVPITAGLAYIRVTPSTGAPRLGEALTLVADFVDANGVATRVTPQWATNQPGRASVSSAGVVTALDTGEVAISATSQGLVGHALLRVLPAPQLDAFSFAPRALYGVTGNDLRASVSVSARDAGAGVVSVEATFTGPNGATQLCTAWAPTSGTVHAGTWDCVLTIPAGSAAGAWHVTRLVVAGSVTRTFTESQLSAFGGTILTVNP